ncbi:Cell adhesion protein byn-1 [Thelohanellus kitauei]|uniref:Cell adhesion protein byn-1 n=1 Tax=Thelohanellus kitauei TaxID=669202 RepID=A0A0C2JNM2_THEKT|nr:Cell adhesion protein byn-1 [Thelohanellus kitauei]
MGRFKKVFKTKKLQVESRPHLTDQIRGKKTNKVKKAKEKNIKFKNQKNDNANQKLARKIVNLAKSESEKRNPVENLLSSASALSIESSDYDIKLEDQTDQYFAVDDTYYDKFIQEVGVEMPDILQEASQNLSLKKIKDQPIECIRNPGISEEIFDTYKKVGLILSKYRSGPLPKAVKIVPILNFYQDLLQIMEPNSWTAASVLQVTRYFVASAKPPVCYE